MPVSTWLKATGTGDFLRICSKRCFSSTGLNWLDIRVMPPEPLVPVVDTPPQALSTGVAARAVSRARREIFVIADPLRRDGCDQSMGVTLVCHAVRRSRSRDLFAHVRRGPDRLLPRAPGPCVVAGPGND